MKDQIKAAFLHAMEGAHVRTEDEIADARYPPYLTDLFDYLFAEEKEPTQDNILEALMDDLEDDFHNCGGSTLDRIKDCQDCWNILDVEHKEELEKFMTEELYQQLTNGYN